MAEGMAKTDRQIAPSPGHGPQRSAITPNADGTLTVHLERLAPPQNVYDADVAEVRLRDADVELVFAQVDTGDGSKLRSRVVVKYAAVPFVKHLWANSRDYHEGLAKHVERFSSLYSVGEHPNVLEQTVTKEHSLRANFDYMARSGNESVIDFFHLSPVGLARFAGGKGTADLVLEPMLRVLLSTRATKDLLDKCATIVDRVESLVQLYGDDL